MKGFIQNIEEETLANTDYRRVLYTGKHSQLVLMVLKHGEEIGEEIHEDSDQFFRFESGEGKVVIDEVSSDVHDGVAVIIPSGAKHNVMNTGAEDLKFYTIYSPSHHKDKTIHHNKSDESEESFDGVTTE